jgi:hypothetical protein
MGIDTFDRMPNREDYLSAPPSHAPKVRAGKPVSNTNIRGEERAGSLISAGGIIWGAYVMTHNFAGTWDMQSLMPGPLPVCAIGILIWLHAKWRRSASRS